MKEKGGGAILYGSEKDEERLSMESYSRATCTERRAPTTMARDIRIRHTALHSTVTGLLYKSLDSITRTSKTNNQLLPCELPRSEKNPAIVLARNRESFCASTGAMFLRLGHQTQLIYGSTSVLVLHTYD